MVAGMTHDQWEWAIFLGANTFGWMVMAAAMILADGGDDPFDWWSFVKVTVAGSAMFMFPFGLVFLMGGAAWLVFYVPFHYLDKYMIERRERKLGK